MKVKIYCEVHQCSSSFARKETYRNHVIQHHENDLSSEEMSALLQRIKEMKEEQIVTTSREFVEN